LTKFFGAFFQKNFKKVFREKYGQTAADFLGSPMENMKFGHHHSSDKILFFCIGCKIGSPLENPFCGYGCGHLVTRKSKDKKRPPPKSDSGQDEKRCSKKS
jgi:hypothetical protein